MDGERKKVRLSVGYLILGLWAVLFVLLLMLLFVPGTEGLAVGR